MIVVQLGGELVVSMFMLATGFAGSPAAAANTIDRLNKRAQKRGEHEPQAQHEAQPLDIELRAEGAGARHESTD